MRTGKENGTDSKRDQLLDMVVRVRTLFTGPEISVCIWSERDSCVSFARRQAAS